MGGVLLADVFELTEAERLLPFVEELLLTLTEFSLLEEEMRWFGGGETDPALPCEGGRW